MESGDFVIFIKDVYEPYESWIDCSVGDVAKVNVIYPETRTAKVTLIKSNLERFVSFEDIALHGSNTATEALIIHYKETEALLEKSIESTHKQLATIRKKIVTLKNTVL